MSRVVRPILVTALALIASASGVSAQQSPAPNAPADSVSAAPTLSIGGRATIRELRVNSEPRVQVNLRGCPLLEEVRIDERSNLPKPVVAGVYRDVVIEAHAAVVLADTLAPGECRGPGGTAPPAGSTSPR